MRWLTVALLVLAASLAWGTERPAKDDASEIVASLVKAYGGSETLTKVTSLTAKGKATDFMSGKSGSYLRYFVRPRRLRVEMMPEQGGDVRVLKGRRGWEEDKDGIVALSDLELQSMLYQYAYLNLPMALASGSYHAEYAGKRSYKGQEVQVLVVVPKGAPGLEVYVDPKSGLIVRVDGTFPVGASGTGELTTEFSDFRKVKGMMFPHKLVSSAGGLRLAEVVLDDVTVNGTIPPNLFTFKEPQ